MINGNINIFGLRDSFGLIYGNFLIQTTNFWQPILDVFGTIPSINCQELAREIIGKELNNELNRELALFRTKRYFAESPYQVKQICELRMAMNKRQLSSEENEKYWRLIDRYSFEPNIWSERLADRCIELIKMDSERLFSVAPKLDRLWQMRCKYISKLSRQMYSRLRTKEAILSQHWVDGKKKATKIYKPHL